MIPLKVCSLCGCTSNETAVFSCSYAKGDLHICLECISEGITEVQKSKPRQEKTMEPMDLDAFDISTPEEVYGFSCEKCGSVMFTSGFPISCECGHINTQEVLKSQDDLMNKKK